MSFSRISMRKLREILRLHFETDLKHRQIARSCSTSHVTVGKYVDAATRAALTWPLSEDLADDEVLYARLFPTSATSAEPSRLLPEWAEVHTQLSAKGMTLQLLWEEYRQDSPDGYGYTQFCGYYRRWKQSVDPVLRHTYKAGEKTFVDWAGLTIPWLDGTGNQQAAHLFVAILALSNYTYAEAFVTTQQWHWIQAHVNAFQYFGGVTEIIVPDNEKTGVTRACNYEPELNPTYQRLAAHYGTVVIPTRPLRPRDKAKVEAAVQHAERRIIAALRHQTFFSVADINEAIRPLLEQLNTSPFQKLPGSRRQRFEQLDQPALKPLPEAAYEFDDWGKAKANIDYHVQVDRNFYSVPYPLVRQVMEVRLTARAIELFHRGRRVAAHRRCYSRGQYITDPGHRPKAHARHLDWSPGRLIAWAAEVGSECAQLLRTLLETKPHPEQGYRACLGIMRLAKLHGRQRTEAACGRALALDSPSFRTVSAILKHGTETDPLPGQVQLKPPSPGHDNVRGHAYYQGKD